MIFTKDNIKYGYRAHVLRSSMMMHYGAIYVVCDKISQTYMKKRPCSSLGSCFTTRVIIDDS